jgi:hypothetical protein
MGRRGSICPYFKEPILFEEMLPSLSEVLGRELHSSPFHPLSPNRKVGLLKLHEWKDSECQCAASTPLHFKAGKA